MFARLLSFVAVTTAMLQLGIGAASAGLIGSTVHVEFLYPDTGTVSEDYGTFVITGSESLANTFNDQDLSFTDNQIILTNTSAGGFNPVTFDGWDVQMISGPDLSGVVEDAASSALFAIGSVLTASATDLKINIAGTCDGCQGGEQILMDLPVSTPEPISLAVLGVGLAGLGFARRRGSSGLAS